MKTRRPEPKAETIPSFMKGFVVALLLLIPLLGYFILRSDPIVYSNNVQKNEEMVKQVQAFAAFIEKKPELVRKPSEQKVRANPAPVTNGSNLPPPSTPMVSAAQIAEAKEMVNELSDIWRQNPPQYDQLWRNQVEKLFDIAEQTGSEEALDVIAIQILAGRVHSDDLNREKADQWIQHYLKLEKRQDKIREISDYYREKVLDRVDRDERKLRENQ